MLLARVLETFGRTYVSSRKLLIGTQGLPPRDRAGAAGVRAVVVASTVRLQATRRRIR